MKPETKKRLEDFIERAEHIRSFSYFEGKAKMIGFEIKNVNGKQQIDFYQPSGVLAKFCNELILGYC